MVLDLSTRVLIVDDAASERSVLLHLVKRIGFVKVDTADNGADAIFAMGKARYGLVIADWQMEPLDGYALLRAIRSDQALAAMPFIMITAHTSMEKVVLAGNAGVNAFISKPFSIGKLKHKITRALHDNPRLSGMCLVPEADDDLA